MNLASTLHKNNGQSAADELQKYREHLLKLKDCFRVSALINSTLELEEVLENIMTTTRSMLRAEACSLMLVDEATGELVFEVAQGPVADKLKTGFRLKSGQGIAGRVLETGEPLLIPDAYGDPRFHPEFDRKTGYRTRSILCVPLKVKERVIGVAQVINRTDGHPFDDEDLETVTLLSSNAAIAVENARMHRALLRKQRMDSDMAFAQSIQLSFLPQNLPRIPGFQFKSHYRPAQEIGGDFYDFIPLDGDRLGVLIGDVSGKGIASALYMAKLTSDFRLLAIREREPQRLIERVNDLQCENCRMGMFVTLIYLVLDPRERNITFVNAGHLPPLVWNCESDRLRVLDQSGGPPIGIVTGRSYPCSRVELASGDCLVLATDGLTEAKGPGGDRLGWERVKAVLRQGSSCVDDVFDRINLDLKRFVGNEPQADDTTIVLVGVEED